MNVSEAGTQAIVMNLRSEGQTSRADYVEALWQALLLAWNDTGEYTRQYSELQEATNSLTAELAALANALWPVLEGMYGCDGPQDNLPIELIPEDLRQLFNKLLEVAGERT